MNVLVLTSCLYSTSVTCSVFWWTISSFTITHGRIKA
jgi:hypothetical protein